MSRTITKLSAVEVKAIKEPGLHWIRDNLYLNVTDTGTRSWIYRFMLNGRSRSMGLGSFRKVSLAAAQQKVSACGEQIGKGIDPIEGRRTARAEHRRAKTRLTFEQGAERYIVKHAATWKNPSYANKWRSSLRAHVFPALGKMDPEEIKTRHVLSVFDPIWHDTPAQAKIVLGRVENIFDDLIVRGERTAANPARWKDYLEHSLPNPEDIRATKHHPWIPFGRAPEFIAALRHTNHLGALPLEFLILTIMRSKEVRLAAWDNIDEEARIWTAQPEDIKGRREHRDDPHRVPLCDRAMEIIAQQKKVKNGPYLFPGARQNGPLSRDVMLNCIKKMGRTDWDCTPHGWRSSFDTWATNQTDYSPQAVQYALTHVAAAAQQIGVSPQVRKAYQHEDMLELRRPLMEDWAVAVLTGKTPARARRPDYIQITA